VDPESRSTESRSMTDNIGDRRVNLFLRKVFELRDVTEKERYPAQQKVVRASLVIAHGNTDVERGLSDNKRVVSKERTEMLLVNIIGITKDAIRFYDPNNENAAKLLITRQSLFGTCILLTWRDCREKGESLKRRSMPK